jgi:predicted helicase
LLKADKVAGRITIDSETVLDDVPPEAWEYQLGNRSALEWVLDQSKEKKAKDLTIRSNFAKYRFADHKQDVIDLLMRVASVSVKTVRITNEMRSAPR